MGVRKKVVRNRKNRPKPRHYTPPPDLKYSGQGHIKTPAKAGLWVLKELEQEEGLVIPWETKLKLTGIKRQAQSVILNSDSGSVRTFHNIPGNGPDTRGRKRRSTTAKMGSSVAYNYTPLTTGTSNEIRLVKILPGEHHSPVSCEIIHTSLGIHPPYEALSYTWGSLDSSQTISVCSNALAVSRNLHGALQRLRLPSKTRMMWIDAISIDQADVAERNQQVGLMRNIFNHAENVVVWLGEESATSERAMAFLKEMGEAAVNPSKGEFKLTLTKGLASTVQSNSVPHPKLVEHNTKDRGYQTKGDASGFADNHLLWGIPVLYYDFSDSVLWDYISEDRNADWEALDELLARPWWARTWVVQEVWNAASVTIICGKASIDWKLFQAAMDYHEAWDEMGDMMIMKKVTRAHVWQKLRRRYSLAIHISKERVHNSSLSDLLWNTWDREATNPADKIYAMLNLVGDRHKNFCIKPDYAKSMVQVFTEAARAILEGQRKMDILLAANGIERKDELPSWCPDWRREANDHRPTLFVNKAKFFKEYVSGSTDFVATRGHGFAACADIAPDFDFDDDLTTLSASALCFDSISELTDVFKVNADRHSWEREVNVYGWRDPQSEGDESLESCIASAESLARRAHWRPTTEEIQQYQNRALNISIRTVGEREDYQRLCEEEESDPIDLGIRLGKVPTAEGVFTEVIWNVLGAGHTAWSESDKKNSQMAVIANVMKGRRFFVTAKGRLGIGPRDAQQGDRVMVIGGCNYPMILRKELEDDETLGLVGEAYGKDPEIPVGVKFKLTRSSTRRHEW